MKEGLVIGVSRINKYLFVLYSCLYDKIEYIVLYLKFSELEKKQISIYLNICHSLNDNLFINSTPKLQRNIIAIFLNCIQTLNEEEQNVLNEIYSNYLEKIEKYANEGLYLEMANLLKCIYNYNELFFSHHEKQLKFQHKIFEEDKILITIESIK